MSVGYNDILKTYPAAAKAGYFDGVVHSEFDAIRRFPLPPEYLRDCFMVNVRSNRHGDIRNSQPCKICSKFIAAFQFKSVFYSMSDNSFGEW